VSELTTASEDGALASIRRLEQTLTEGATTRTVADSLRSAARSEAERILAAAEQAAVAASVERRRQAQAAAESETATIRARGESSAAALRANAAAVRDATVDAALALIVTTASEGVD
jgi:vacuolar-type H+-ATPase subunit H